MTNGWRSLLQSRLPRRAALRRKTWLVGIGAVAMFATATFVPLSQVTGGFTKALASSPPPLLDLTDTIQLVSRRALAGPINLQRLSDGAEDMIDRISAPHPLGVDADDALPSPLRAYGRELLTALFATASRREKRAQSYSIPGLDLVVRTDSAGRLQELIHRTEPRESLRLRAVQPYESVNDQPEKEIRLAYVTGTIERSLFEAGQQAGLSDPLILELAELFGWDIDFALDIRPGDGFAVIHEEKYWHGQKVADGDILAAEFLSGGQIYRAIGLRGGNGKITYYTPSGTSLRRAFLRAPVKFSRVSSSFANERYHPILKSWRAHNGVDYSAPRGTPVRTTASGRITSVGWNGGYGNTIVINHGGAYSTLYAHLSRYRAGLRPGEYVRQGELIGHVGQTGLASGPHLHYELQVNGQHQNPLTFKFPLGEPIPADLRAEFLRSARFWLARLDLINGRRLASR